MPEELDPCVPDDALDVFMRATENMNFNRQAVLASRTAPNEETLEGSDNWVAVPARTVTGRPILANDPHHVQGVPSLRYVVHLSAPGLDVGPLPREGRAYAVNVPGYHLNGSRRAHGPSFCIVLDVGNRDNSRAINTPAQSGDPANSRYRDLATSWLERKYFPLLHSRHAVEKAAGQVIELVPAPR